jgi:hypothetical protein
MEAIMLIKLAVTLMLLFAVSCTPTPTPSTPAQSSAPFEPPKWVKSSPSGSIAPSTGHQEVGWDDGFILTDAGVGWSEVATSEDGRDWRVAAPQGMTELAVGEGRTVAGYGAAGYLLGWASKQLTVWRTEDGERWEPILLDLGGLKIDIPLDLELTITAGPRGVLVVGNDNYHPPSFQGVYVWYSPDGHSFRPMAQVPGPVSDLPPIVEVASGPTDFLMGLTSNNKTVLLSSEDGVHWQNTSAKPPSISFIDHMSTNASTTVMFASRPDDPLDLPRPWYRRGDTWRPARLDPGRLPDAGVVPAEEVRVNAVRNWGTGFIAVGNTFGEEGKEIAGLVWHSADGSTWTRMPVRDNGFDKAAVLMDVAVSRNKATLIGFPSDDSEKLLIWHAEAPSTR